MSIRPSTAAPSVSGCCSLADRHRGQERSDGNLRLYGRLGYTEIGREPTTAGYALVHLRKARHGAIN
ncbi:MAG: hypothetical protein ACRDUW_07410 [Pseudonocardiaceae bacterium]